MKKWITSDLHFHHKNILKYKPEYRPFDGVIQMNEHIILDWSAKVKPGDTIYSLGDFSFGNEEKTRQILDRLSGNKVFILGNHCRKLKDIYKEYGEVYDYLELKHDKKKVILSHYPMSVWNGSHYGSVMLHGHCHGTFTGKGRIMDVGWDSLGEIKTLERVVGQCLNKDIVNLDGHTGERK